MMSLEKYYRRRIKQGGWKASWKGQSSGKGGTSTRGHKGAKSRSGYSKKIGFEGDKCHFKKNSKIWVQKL